MGKGFRFLTLHLRNFLSFFEDYQWHLDERPLRNDNEINPDVLGYIFEKYINQKQMGAYYTKEDITEYISKNTIIPFLFDAHARGVESLSRGKRVSGNCYKPTQTVTSTMPSKRVSNWIYRKILRQGIHDVSKRGTWNTPAPDEYANPTEIWREVVARRDRYETVHAKLSNGEIDDINALITDNLDIHQFAQDVIENCEGPDLLRAFWKASLR